MKLGTEKKMDSSWFVTVKKLQAFKGDQILEVKGRTKF